MSTTRDRVAELLTEKRRRQAYEKLNYFFPDEDIFNFPNIKNGYIPARNKYPHHLEFFRAGKLCSERLFMAANATGKSFAGGYEDACHLLGEYPSWWEGKRFNRAVVCWVVAPNKTVCRNGIQKVLLGNFTDIGSGLIPKDKIVPGSVRLKPNSPEAIECFKVYSKYGISEVTFKSYEEETNAFSGAAIDLIHLDEEPPYPIYIECKARTIRVEGGLMYITFTPDKGLSDTILTFFPDGIVKDGPTGTKYCVSCDFSSVPHMSEQEKREFFDSLPPHIREAKYYGRAYAAAGLVYPVYRGNYEVEPHKIPSDWPRCFAMDVGWNRTAVLWAAFDPETKTWYIYDEYYVGQLPPSHHAPSILRRGSWIPGVVDYHSKSHHASFFSEYDEYLQLGLDVTPSMTQTDVESGIQKVWSYLSTGKIKVWANLSNFFKEINTYRYDVGNDGKGKIVKKETYHLMDCLRYLVENGEYLARVKPIEDEESDWESIELTSSGRSIIGGY